MNAFHVSTPFGISFALLLPVRMAEPENFPRKRRRCLQRPEKLKVDSELKSGKRAAGVARKYDIILVYRIAKLKDGSIHLSYHLIELLTNS